jgi:hypothetical protein
MCDGLGVVRLNPLRPRECPTCRGSGRMVLDRRFRDGFDARANEVGLAPRRTALEGDQ